MPNIYTASFEEKEELNDRFDRYQFELIEPHRMDFSPGQYLELTQGNKKLAFFICSSPNIDHGFEFIFDKSISSATSNYLQTLKFGDQVQIEGPSGNFLLQPNESKNLYFITRGYGIGPIKSMLDHLIQHKQSKSQLYLIWAMEKLSDFFWLQDFLDLEESLTNFHFNPVLENPQTDWTLSTGKLSAVLSKMDIFDESMIYLCLEKNELEPIKKIFSEKKLPNVKVISQFL